MDYVLEKAKNGDLTSQKIVWSGLMNDIPCDNEKIEYWLIKAAEQCDIDSTVFLIEFFEKKLGDAPTKFDTKKTIDMRYEHYKKILSLSICKENEDWNQFISKINNLNKN